MLKELLYRGSDFWATSCMFPCSYEELAHAGEHGKPALTNTNTNKLNNLPTSSSSIRLSSIYHRVCVGTEAGMPARCR